MSPSVAGAGPTQFGRAPASSFKTPQRVRTLTSRRGRGAVKGPAGRPACRIVASCVSPTGAASTRAQRWPAPLDRAITLHARDVALRDALDRLAAAARVHLTYSAEFLPLDRSVCFAYDAMPLGAALTTLLLGTAVEPVAAGADQVVLTPARGPATSAPARPGARPVTVLDQVVVTGSVTGGAARGIPVALDVLRGPAVGARGRTTLSEAMDGGVPGMWVWEQSPANLFTPYASMRGASSFGVSYPKVYIDGIEVASPLLVTAFDPDVVERIEVIRGPQGAALYGAGAISGVINIVTRHDGPGAGAERLQVRSGLGMSGTEFAPHPAFAQDYALTLRDGSGTRSVGLAVTGGTLGAFIPGAYSREATAVADARLVSTRAIITGTARLFAHEAGAPASPILNDLVTAPPGPQPTGPVTASSGPQSVWQYTLGSTATLPQNERWTHSATFGVDGYRLADVPNDRTPIPSAVDSALRAARGGADRATLRVSTVGYLGADERASAALTLAAEQSVLREETAGDQLAAAPNRQPANGSATTNAVDWLSTSALVAQSNTVFRNTFFLTGGMRVERNDGFTAASRLAALPMLGGAIVGARGDVTVKLRAAYGTGIRPPRTPSRETVWSGVHSQITRSDLGAEEQSGIEGGIDLFIGRALALHVTRFDQRASGLIQQVAVAVDTQPNSTPPPRRSARERIGYELQNVGSITNRGWEMQGSAGLGRLSVSGTLSLVESRVQRLATGYTGDLQPGNRMLQVPARTAGLSALWSGTGWSASVSAARASDWINYDRLALARAFATSDRPLRTLVGAPLRAYWREYRGVTRVRANASREVLRGLDVMLTGDNLLDQQRGEPDNITVLPGRTITFGARARF